MRIVQKLIPAASALLLGTTALAAPGDQLAIRADRVHVGDGTVIENGIVLFKDGKIVEVGKGAPVPKDVVLLEHAGDLSAGLVSLRGFSGATGETLDRTRSVMDKADLAYAFRPGHSQMDALLEEGITTFVLAPGNGTLVGGLCAVVKPGKEVISRQAMLAVASGKSALTSNRYPTSFQGAQAELDRLFSWPSGSFALAVKGELPVLLSTGTSRFEVQNAIQFARRHGLKGVLIGSDRVGELAAQVRAAGLGVAVKVFQPGSRPRGAEGAVALAKLKVPFGFALEGPSNHPASLRLTAAACIRAGLDPKVALQALTSTAAELAGVADQLGSVKVGLAADLVLWSGAPTDPGSRVIAVYVDGAEVYRAAPEENGEDE